MRKKIPKTVGSLIVYDDEDDEWSMKWAIEQDYGKNCRGEKGLFYLNLTTANTSNPDNRVYYMSTVSGGYIEATDPNFYKYAYTYNQLLELCHKDQDLLQKLTDLLIGQDPRVVYEEIKPQRRDNRGKHK